MAWKKTIETEQKKMDKTAEAVMKELRAEYRRQVSSRRRAFRRKQPVSFTLTWYLPDGMRKTDPPPQEQWFPRIRKWIRKRNIRKQLRRITLRTRRLRQDPIRLRKAFGRNTDRERK